MDLGYERTIMKHRKLATGFLAVAMVAGSVAVVQTDQAVADLVSCSGVEPPVGTGGPDSPYEISEAGHLQWIAEGTDDRRSRNYLVTEPIDLGGCLFSPIGTDESAFSGTFDGGNKVINKLTIDPSGFSTAGIGLFGWTNGATLTRVILENVDVTGGEGVGGLVGRFNHFELIGVAPSSEGSISHSSVTGTVSGQLYVGGLVGYFDGIDGVIDEASATAVIEGDESVGGLVGYLRAGEVFRSFAEGNVTGLKDDNVGGLVGYGRGSIQASYATGTVVGDGDVGGLVGDLRDGQISGSYAVGNVTGTSNDVGGLVGYSRGDSSVSQSFATGNVTGIGRVGGLVGWLLESTVIDSYSTGDVTGTEPTVGGFAGVVDDASVERSYSIGQVTGSSSVGGFVGSVENAGEVSASFWSTDASGQDLGFGNNDNVADPEVFGKTLEGMRDIAIYSANSVGWLITNDWTDSDSAVWGICPAGSDVQVNDGLPYLLWEYDSNPCAAPEAESGSTGAAGVVEKRSSLAGIHLDLQAESGQRVAGTTVIIGGQGLFGESPYSLVVRSSPQVLATGQASSLGNFSARTTLPDLAPGQHTLTLTATALDGSVLSLMQVFTVGTEGTFTAMGSPSDTQAGGLAVTGVNGVAGGLGLAGFALALGLIMVLAARKYQATR